MPSPPGTELSSGSCSVPSDSSSVSSLPLSQVSAPGGQLLGSLLSSVSSVSSSSSVSSNSVLGERRHDAVLALRRLLVQPSVECRARASRARLDVTHGGEVGESSSACSEPSESAMPNATASRAGRTPPLPKLFTTLPSPTPRKAATFSMNSLRQRVHDLLQLRAALVRCGVGALERALARHHVVALHAAFLIGCALVLTIVASTPIEPSSEVSSATIFPAAAAIQ